MIAIVDNRSVLDDIVRGVRTPSFEEKDTLMYALQIHQNNIQTSTTATEAYRHF